MCTLTLVRPYGPGGAFWLAANRDEERARSAAPPGLFVGEQRRMLSPRDRRAGGTWLAVGDLGHVAALTNLVGAPQRSDAPSRGHLPHRALDAVRPGKDGLDCAVASMTELLDAEPHSGFQLLIADAERSALIVHDGEQTELLWPDPEQPLAISNQHRLGSLELPLLTPAAAPDLSEDERSAAMVELLADQGAGNPQGHVVCKLSAAEGDAEAEGYGTVSSSIVALHPQRPASLLWRYARGKPEALGEYRNYGNLVRRLVGPG